MFKKKPIIKALAPLRSSDRRRIADEVISDLGLGKPESPDASDEAKAAATAERSALRNSLFPENVQSARFTTTAGPELKQVSGTIYAGSQPGEDTRILWVRTQHGLYPTVYTLWRNARVVPLLHTPGIVVAKLQSGADLMTPGLANGPPFPAGANKGAIVAIASIESPSVPVAVGVCEIDVSSLQKVQGSKGHAVNTIHWAGDELWAWSDKGKPGGHTPDHLEGWIAGHEATDGVSQATAKLNIADAAEDGGVALQRGAEQNSSEEQPGNSEEPPLAESHASEERELTTKDIDDTFRNAFLYGIHHYKSSNSDAANHGLDFPLTQSFVMSNLVQPFLPAFTPAQAQKLQIKNTSWKSIKKFIKHFDKERLVKSKDRQGNEVVILDIDFDDSVVLNFKPYKLPPKDIQSGTSLGRGEKANNAVSDSTDDPSVGQKLDRLELFRPKEKLAPIFSSSANSRNLFTAFELRAPIDNYIITNNLVNPSNKRLVKLDPVLGDVFDSSVPLDKDVLAKGEVPRDALVERTRQGCSRFWVILRGDEDLNTTSVKPKAGVAPKITITLETRSGNKTATRVSGLEPYFIPPKPLADELRKTCAGSTSVEQMQGSSPRDPKMEVMVQGPQRDAVLKALEKRRINVNLKSGWVEVVDKTKKKK